MKGINLGKTGPAIHPGLISYQKSSIDHLKLLQVEEIT